MTVKLSQGVQVRLEHDDLCAILSDQFCDRYGAFDRMTVAAVEADAGQFFVSFVPEAADTIVSLVEALTEARNDLKRIADAPAWGAPERWETTPSEVRWLAKDTVAKIDTLLSQYDGGLHD